MGSTQRRKDAKGLGYWHGWPFDKLRRMGGMGNFVFLSFPFISSHPRRQGLGAVKNLCSVPFEAMVQGGGGFGKGVV